MLLHYLFTLLLELELVRVELEVESVLAPEPAVEVVPDCLVVHISVHLGEYVADLLFHQASLLLLLALCHTVLFQVVPVFGFGEILLLFLYVFFVYFLPLLVLVQ